MATLRQTLRGLPQADEQLVRGPGGVLQRTPTLQATAQQAKLAAPPTTPMGAQMVGAGPEAAKMAGTPQQMKAALESTAEAGKQTLQTALRRKQYGRETTAQEKSAMAKSADMQKLGGLGDRVTRMIQDEYTKGTAATAPAGSAGAAPVLDVKAGTAKYFEGKELKPVTTDLQKLQTAQPGSEEYNKLLINLNTQLGYGPEFGKEILTADQLQSMYKSSAEVIGEGLAGKVRDLDMVKAMEFASQLGYDANSLANLLGVTPQDIQKYSLADLQNKVNEVTSKEFTRAQQLEQQAASPLVGVAERGLAREASRELSATGVRATEADMQKLADEVTAASTVTFMNQTKSIDQWLANDEISAMIKDVVESPADSKIRMDLKKTSPQLSDFIERNEGALKVAAQKLETGATQFKQLQEQNKKLILDAGLSERAAKTFAEKVLGLQFKEFTEEDIPILNYIKDLSDTDKQIVSNEINDISSKDPTLAKEVATLNSNQLTALGIGKKGSNWDKMKAYNDKLAQIESIPKDNYDQLIRETYGDVGSVEAANQRIADGNKLKALGLDPGVSTFSLDPSKLKENLVTGKQKVTATKAAAGNIPQMAKQTLGTPTIPTGTVGSIVNKLGSLLQDGKLTKEEFATSYDKNNPISQLNLDEMIELENISKKPNTSIDQEGTTNRRKYLSNVYTRDVFTSTKGTDSALQASMRIINNHGFLDNQKIDRELLGSFVETENKEDLDLMDSILAGQKVPSKWGLAFPAVAKAMYDAIGEASRFGVASPRMLKTFGKLRELLNSGALNKVPNPSPTVLEKIQGVPAQIMGEVGKGITAVAAPVVQAVTSVAAPVVNKTEQVITSGAKKTEAFAKNLKKGKIRL